MRRRACLRSLVLLLLGVALASSAQAAEVERSDELAELLAAEEDGEPVLDEELRRYFDSLPPRAVQLVEQAIEDELVTEADHLRVLLAPRLDAPDFELLMEDRCVVCHTDPWQEPGIIFTGEPVEWLPAGMNLRDFTSDVHFRRGLSCAGCHGGDPADLEMSDPIYERMPEADERREDRSWIPEFCARCHADSVFMRPYDPDLPTDQFAKYKESRHGHALLEEGDSAAAQCVSCHGAHGIRDPRSSRASVHPRNVAETCGGCHSDAERMAGRKDRHGDPLPTDQLAQYKESVHGRALLEEGDLGAATCNDCHGSHAAAPPEVASVAHACRSCHASAGELFDGSNHKQAFDEHDWPECGKCHGEHNVQEADDSMLAPAGGEGLCQECHREFARDNPECERTAEYFHTTLTGLVEEVDGLEARAHTLRERGLDADPLLAKLEELHDIVRRARTGIHAFDRGEFEPLEAEGENATQEAEALVEEARAEYRFRRNGLLASLGLMGLLATLLWLKIRDLESVQAEPPSHEGGDAREGSER